MKLGVFLRVFSVKLQRENARNAEATTQEIKYQQSPVNNPSSSVTVRQATPRTDVRLGQHRA